jgi:hypothetical protein
MPLTPADLATIVAEALNLPLATVKNYDRKLMEAGLRTKKGHGRGSALMGPRDAAVLLAAIASSDEIARVSESVRWLYDMPYMPPPDKTDSGLIRIPELSSGREPAKLSFLSDLIGVDEKAIDTFGAALVAVMEHLVSNSNRINWVSRHVAFEVFIGRGMGLPYSARLAITLPKKSGRIAFWRSVMFQKSIRADLMITRAIVGVDAIADVLASQMNGKSGEAI